jgi:hypothetical protein
MADDVTADENTRLEQRGDKTLADGGRLKLSEPFFLSSLPAAAAAAVQSRRVVAVWWSTRFRWKQTEASSNG